MNCNCIIVRRVHSAPYIAYSDVIADPYSLALTRALRARPQSSSRARAACVSTWLGELIPHDLKSREGARGVQLLSLHNPCLCYHGRPFLMICARGAGKGGRGHDMCMGTVAAQRPRLTLILIFKSNHESRDSINSINRMTCQTLSGPLPQSGSPAREARGAATHAAPHSLPDVKMGRNVRQRMTNPLFASNEGLTNDKQSQLIFEETFDG